MTSLAASPIDGAILAQRAGHEVRSPVSPAAVTQAGGSTESRVLEPSRVIFSYGNRRIPGTATSERIIDEN